MQTPNATRMELKKLREKQKTAKKGHKLLKEKVTELIRAFFSLVQDIKILRQEVDDFQKYVFQEYESAKAKLSDQEINLLFAIPTKTFEIEFETENFLGIDVPLLRIKENELNTNMPYSPLSSTSLMDKTVGDFYELFPKILELAVLEKKAFLLCNEIEKGKRRVNALENVLIPTYEMQIEEIENKLSENERDTNSRLQKVKDKITESD